MAHRYQDRPFGAGHGRGGDQHGSDREESDPLAELARLIGQTDSFGAAGKANPQVSPRPAPRQEARQEYRQDPRQAYRQDFDQDYQSPPEPEEPTVPSGPPAWMQRANYRREAPRETSRETSRESLRETPRQAPRELPPEPEADGEDYLSPVHPLHRHAAPPQQPPADT